MRFGGYTAAFIIAGCLHTASGQQPRGPLAQQGSDQAVQGAGPQGGLHAEAPLTEQQLREQRIRAMDPLSKDDAVSSPAGSGQNKVAGTPGAGAPLNGAPSTSNRTPVNRSGQGPEVAVEGQADPGQADGDQPEFAGPAVLSRSYTLNRQMAGKHTFWTPTLSVNALYTSGAAGGNVEPGGTLNNATSFGTGLAWALAGRHLWKRDQLGLDYHGGWNYYNDYSNYSGTNHTLNLAFTHQFTRRLSFNLGEAASVSSQNYNLINPALGNENSVANMSATANPSVQIPESRLRQSSTTAGILWQKSARLSFSFSGGYLGISRTGTGVLGNTGYSSNADVNYRYTRRTTVGLYYAFIDYTYSHDTQMSSAHTLGVIYSYALSRTLQFRMKAGASRIESQSQIRLPLDPALAALVGQTSIVFDSYRKLITSDLSAEIAKDFGHRRSARISYGRGITPGNGVQLTSIQEAFTAGFGMPIFRNYSMDIGGGDVTLAAVGQTIGKYGSRFAGVGISHTYPRGVSGNLSAYYRTFDITNAPADHGQFSVSLGISWSPGENPTHLF